VAAPNADGRVLAGARLLEGILGLDTLTPVEPRPPKTGRADADQVDQTAP
jgi:hypothetical protein